MKILTYDLYCGAAKKAIEQCGHEFMGYIPRSPVSDNPRRLSVADKICGSQTHIPNVDVLLTCADPEDAPMVKSIVKASKAMFVIWAMPPDLELTSKAINKASVPLQMLDLDTSLLQGVSSHTLGFNYKENRSFLIATCDKREVLTPKLKLLYPEGTLTDVLNTSKDEVLERFDGNKQVFHKEPRPWNYVSIPTNEFHIQAHKVGPKLGSVLYLIDGKVHRLTSQEANAVCGNPDGFDEEVSPHCETDGGAVFCILAEPSVAVWSDLLERVLYAGN
jgi:hypothetical protein